MRNYFSLLFFSTFIFSNFCLLSNENCNEIRIFPLSLKDSIEEIDGEQCVVFRGEDDTIYSYECGDISNYCINRTRIEPDINSQIQWEFPAFDKRGVKFKILPPKGEEEIPFQFHIMLSDDKNNGEVKILWNGKNWIFRIPKGTTKWEEVKGSLEELQNMLKFENPDYNLIKAFQYFLDNFPNLDSIEENKQLALDISMSIFGYLPSEILDFSEIVKKLFAPGTTIGVAYHCKSFVCIVKVCVQCGMQLVCNTCFLFKCWECSVVCEGPGGIPAAVNF